MDKDIISCVIPTYQQMLFVFDAINSVLNQDYAYIELVITDDGTADFDESRIRSYIRENKNENLVGYKVLHHENFGTVRNLNYGISQCTGKIIAVLASDDQLYSTDVFSKVMGRFRSSKCKILACSRMKFDETMVTPIRLMPHPKYISFIKRHLNTPIKQYRFMALGSEMEFASGAAMYYTREYFDSVKGYDERYILWEDGPFIARAVRGETAIDLAYDIIAVKYRDGGISSKKRKTSTQSKIEGDYEHFYIWEFAEHSNILGKYLTYSANGLSRSYSAEENKGTLSFCVMIGKISLLLTKVIKFYLRYHP